MNASHSVIILFGETIKRLSFRLTGKNLFTITDYSGYDPEVGEGGGQIGTAVLNRFDGFAYPHFRTYSGSIEIEF